MGAGCFGDGQEWIAKVWSYPCVLKDSPSVLEFTPLCVYPVRRVLNRRGNGFVSFFYVVVGVFFGLRVVVEWEL